jgi:hypothetical protein
MKLLALRCPTCAQPLKPQNPEVVVLRCAGCGTAVSITHTGLTTTTIEFAAPDVAKFDGWLPLWLFNGRVNITSRQTQGRNKQAEQDAQQLWGYPRRLYMPAWDLPTAAACQLGGDLVQRQPQFQPSAAPSQGNFVEAVLAPEDALKLLEFVVFNVEAGRRDWLKELHFTIEAEPPQLWALPALWVGGEWHLQPILK